MHDLWNALWYRRHPLGLVLSPLSWVYCLGAVLRGAAYRSGLATVERVGAPLLVVGNLTVGGTGKTPLVIWLVRHLAEAGYRPGVVSRGYGGRARRWPQQVRADSDPRAVGDEPVLIARRTGRPVVAAPQRVEAARALLEHTDCDIIVADDGLQHLALGRDLEIAVIDAIRRLGSRRCLPAGPLREPASRLRTVDLVVCNGPGQQGEFSMRYAAGSPRGVADETRERPLAELAGEPVHAVAGIGNPPRFFAQLRGAGLRIIEHAFADHHDYQPRDLDFGDGREVLMTEKDAVKCRRFASARHWYLPIEAQLPPEFGARVLTLIRRNPHGQEAA